MLLSGGFDRKARIADVRTGSDASTHAATWALPADVETVGWDLTTPGAFVVAMEDGSVAMFDGRMAGKGGKGGKGGAVWTLAAHGKACCSMATCAGVPGLLATGSLDKTVKLWDARSGKEPELLCTKKLKCGHVFTLAFNQEQPLLAVGGTHGELTVWDVRGERGVEEAFVKSSNGGKGA